MIYTLDTNVVSAILKGDQSVASKVEEVIERGDEVTLNAISYYETERGLLILSINADTHFLGSWLKSIRCSR